MSKPFDLANLFVKQKMKILLISHKAPFEFRKLESVLKITHLKVISEAISVPCDMCKSNDDKKESYARFKEIMTALKTTTAAIARSAQEHVLHVASI